MKYVWMEWLGNKSGLALLAAVQRPSAPHCEHPTENLALHSTAGLFFRLGNLICLTVSFVFQTQLESIVAAKN